MKFATILLCVSCLYSVALAQQYAISGYVRDSSSGEELIGAMVYEPKTNTAVLTNEYGFYTISLPVGEYELSCSYMGYKAVQHSLHINAHAHHNFALHTEALKLSMITVQAHRTASMHSKQLSIQLIEQTPSTFGVPDVIKVIQTQSGIKTVGDGSSGFYVRGGNRDQNMVQIDEACIYNISHLYGYVSSFNPNMLKDVVFYNSYIPAEFGGRLSSVLDAKMKEGNMNSYSADIILSTLTANANIEGPIKKDTASFFFAARRSTLDLLLNNIVSEEETPSFFDANGK